ncbi:MAG: zinc-dependent metalloproteinase lipoprotein [Prevotella sp.]
MNKKAIITKILCSLFVVVALIACDKEPFDNGKTVKKEEKEAPKEINDNTLYELPVVFHVLSNSTTKQEYIPNDANLRRLLFYVNELYAGGIYGPSANIRVKFVAATEDEKGEKMKTQGVVYEKWDEKYPINSEDFMTNNSNKYTKYLWDPNKYINVFVYLFDDEDNEGEVLGVSHMPYKTKENATLQGLEQVASGKMTKKNIAFPLSVSINAKYINTLSGRYTSTLKLKTFKDYKEDDVVVTLAHEFGHYLGLFHVFAEDRKNGIIDDCIDSDYCQDTPSYNKKQYERDVMELAKHLTNKNVHELFQRKNCSGKVYDATNIMDYAYCYSYAFTANQQYRMRQVLYYSPLIPGPKKTTTTRSVAPDKVLDLPIRISKCPH